jgi:hypothetical protein
MLFTFVNRKTLRQAYVAQNELTENSFGGQFGFFFIATTMGRLFICCADFFAASARRRTTAH